MTTQRTADDRLMDLPGYGFAPHHIQDLADLPPLERSQAGHCAQEWGLEIAARALPAFD